jgi:guanylate kinase
VQSPAEISRDRKYPDVVAVAGPPGVGKTSAVNGVLEACSVSVRPASLTTRPPRPGEENSRQFDHVTHGEYVKVEAAGDLLASYPSFGKHRYGLTRTALERVPTGVVPLMELDPRNIRQLRQHCRVTSVLIIAPSALDMLKRLQARGPANDEQGLKLRWQGGIELLEFNEAMNYVIINASLRQTISELRAIVESEWLANHASERAIVVQHVLETMKALEISELPAWATAGLPPGVRRETGSSPWRRVSGVRSSFTF